MTSFSFDILPATEADIPTLASIAGAASEGDTNAMVKSNSLSTLAEEHASNMEGPLSSWLSRPGKCSLLKAVDKSTSATIGWACWANYGLGNEPTPTAEQIAEEKAKPIVTQQHIIAEAQNIQSGVQRLKEITSKDMERWIDKIMPAGTKCRYIVSIAVHPSFQGKGVGKALIRWGAERADAEGAICWVHSSDGGWKAFQALGFEEIERLELDLDQFAEIERPGGGKWGIYTFRYGVRQPR